MIRVISFSLLNWQEDPPRRGKADYVPIAIGRSTGNASVYHLLCRFLPFTGAIADIQIKKYRMLNVG